MEDIIIIDKDPNDPNDHDNAGEISFQEENPILGEIHRITQPGNLKEMT
jgi:hypothetical protein